MKKYLSVLFLISSIACTAQKKSIIRDNVIVAINTYEDNHETKAAAMPDLNPASALMNYKKRFEYLLINVSAIHAPGKAQERTNIWKLYPDTVTLKRLYLDKFIEDKQLVRYFEATAKYIKDPNLRRELHFTQGELMEVASKFFYCDEILPDTSVQAHVCVGLNGIKEAQWQRDYTLLQAFCYEGIFSQFDNDTSQLWDSFIAEKKISADKFRSNMTSIPGYLQDVKLDLFERMKNNEALKKELLAYYEANKHNLAFTITE